MGEEQLLLFLIQVFVVLALARLLGEIFRRFDQPPLVGEILAGLLLGKTVLGGIFPEFFASLFPDDELQLALFEVTAQFGVLFLLLAIGLEVDIASAWKLRRQALSVAVMGVLFPMLLGTGFAWVFYDSWSELNVARLPFSLFVGTAVSITAITVVARLLFDLKIVKSDLGLLLLSAMAINELLGWVVLALVLGMLGSGQPADIALVVIGTILFSVLCATYGRRVATRLLIWFEEKELPIPATPLSFVVCLGLACGIITEAIGIHPIFGFLIAGVMAGDQKALSEHTRFVITQMVEAIFVPLFFAGICLHIDFIENFRPGLILMVTAVSIFGKFAGAGLGSWLANMPAFDRLPTAIAHTPGGSMGVLLAVVGKEAEVIGPQMFVALVFASIASSIVVAPAFNWSLQRRKELNVLGFFTKRGLVPRLAASERFDVIDELVALAVRIYPNLDSDSVRQAVRAREETMGTGIGQRVAIPHARLDTLTRPLVLLGISELGIDWNAIDDQPAHLIFLILTPADDQDTQLEILSTIAVGLGEKESRDLQHAESISEIWKVLVPMLRKD